MTRESAETANCWQFASGFRDFGIGQSVDVSRFLCADSHHISLFASIVAIAIAGSTMDSSRHLRNELPSVISSSCHWWRTRGAILPG